MWELDCEESWVLKNWLLLNGAGEDSREALGQPSDETSPSWRRSTLNVHWKDWRWSWSSSPVPPDAKSWLIGKDPDAGKDRGQEENGATEDEIVGWPWVINSMIVSLSKFQETVKDKEAWQSAVHGVAKNWTRLSNWATTKEAWQSSLASSTMWGYCEEMDDNELAIGLSPDVEANHVDPLIFWHTASITVRKNFCCFQVILSVVFC